MPYEKLDGIERCIDDEIPFEIPESWEWTRLRSIASVLGGKRIPAGRRLTTENTGYVYIRVSDMKDGWVSTKNLQYVPEDIFPSISKYISLFATESRIYPTATGEGDFSSSLYFCFLLFLAMKILLSI